MCGVWLYFLNVQKNGNRKINQHQKKQIWLYIYYLVFLVLFRVDTEISQVGSGAYLEFYWKGTFFNSTVPAMVGPPDNKPKPNCYVSGPNHFFHPNQFSTRCVVVSFNSWLTVPLAVVVQTRWFNLAIICVACAYLEGWFSDKKN